ncbi:uncharacterized protein TNCV_4237481 [Trichonephila clavipes]|nr:uncharacterized protein TNCV_4237481 [Trichonephila clavipes]
MAHSKQWLQTTEDCSEINVFLDTDFQSSSGRGSLVDKVTDSWLACQEFDPSVAEDPPSNWSMYRIVADLVTSSSTVQLKTRRVGKRCTLNLSRAQMSSRWCGVVVRRGVPAQVSCTSLDHGSKLRGPSPKSPPVAEQCDSLVYAHKPQTLDHLEDNIRRVTADIRPQMLEKVIENWTSRLDYIRASRGSPMPEIIFKM